MYYQNTLITASDDSGKTSAAVPAARGGKPTAASIEYELIVNNPYRYTQEDVQFQSHLARYPEQAGLSRDEFFSNPKACFRASPLVKKFGWGIHYDQQGKIALIELQSPQYAQLLNDESVTVLKGIRSSRKK
ncbi:hypothetical protein GKZ89_07985 [Bacillus mangrovi]|uniref:Uncharacterized protein n=1 Tax=Metabacillus mangrovi TaxID=1491830 RepID=A0A7X2V4T4_9BACI|nr:DUF6157 family protein [Metabacillus mangrovi]MTH53353.1 hypothetical protein [Metabacillus mangrovi]